MAAKTHPKILLNTDGILDAVLRIAVNNVVIYFD